MRDLSYYDFEDSRHESFTRKELNQHDYPDENGMFPSLNELKRRVIAERERLEAKKENKRYADLALAEEERERAINLAQETEHTDYDYYEDYLGDPGDEYCPDCGTNGPDEGYHISTSQIICRCSPLYPDLRPSDYPNNSSCSCNVVKYVYLHKTICMCTSPDLHALLERQHELGLTLNLIRILPDKRPSLYDDIPF